MAKGDAMGGAAKMGGPPKMDQYSVMHQIMERLGQGGGSIAPSVMPGSQNKFPVQGFNPTETPIGGMSSGTIDNGSGISPLTNNYGGQMGGNIQPMGGSIAPRRMSFS